MGESQKTFMQKVREGFFDKYMKGYGLELGYRGYDKSETLLKTSKGIELDYPGYDGLHLPLEPNTQDYVYCSHVLEHIASYSVAISEWHRVTKPKGYIIIVVPHRDLYEKKLTPPSRFNSDHKRFYTAASLLKEIEDSLPINSYRIRHLRENDEGHDYSQAPEEHSKWLYEIETVLEKL